MSNVKEIKRYRKGIKKIMKFHKQTQRDSTAHKTFRMDSYYLCAMGKYIITSGPGFCQHKFKYVFGFESDMKNASVQELRDKGEFEKALVVELFSPTHGNTLTYDEWLKIAKDVRKQLKGMIEE